MILHNTIPPFCNITIHPILSHNQYVRKDTTTAFPNTHINSIPYPDLPAPKSSVITPNSLCPYFQIFFTRFFFWKRPPHVIFVVSRTLSLCLELCRYVQKNVHTSALCADFHTNTVEYTEVGRSANPKNHLTDSTLKKNKNPATQPYQTPTPMPPHLFLQHTTKRTQNPLFTPCPPTPPTTTQSCPHRTAVLTGAV